MSAIYGLINLDNKPVARDDLERMNSALSAHGADGGGFYIEGPAGLGQRLMCFVPEDRFDRQPLRSADGRFVLVGDARIYNRPELAQELGLSQDEASRLPDSAFIMKAFQRWADRCTLHLVGDFAFALWDKQERSLFAATSPNGMRTLFYHSSPRAFAFATMPGGLLALPSVPRVLNEERVARFLVSVEPAPGSTFYEGVWRLPEGHQLTVTAQRCDIRRYWEFDPKHEIRFARDEDYVEAFDELFARVVKEHLRSTSPVGVLTSGGLDSSSIAVTAAEMLRPRGEQVRVYTAVPRPGFDGPVGSGRYADETPFVRALADRHKNVDLQLVNSGRRTFLDDLDLLFASAEAPLRNVANRAWMEEIVARAGEQGVRVLLIGDGGNLSVSYGGDKLLAQLISRGRWARAVAEARGLVRNGRDRSVWRVLAAQGLRQLLPPPILASYERLRGRGDPLSSPDPLTFSAINPALAARHNLADVMNEERRSIARDTRLDSRRRRFEWLTMADVGAMVAAGYRAMFGVEGRAPLIDARLVRFCLALPEDQYLRDGESRRLIRRAMAKRLPPQILANKQRGLQAADWFEMLDALRPRIAAELEQFDRSPLISSAIDVPKLRRLVENWPQEWSGSIQQSVSYRLVLASGLMMGRFLLWFEIAS